MIQINLLPDVKREFIKAQQTKHTVLVVSVIASVSILAVLALLFSYVQFAQPRHITNLQEDIDMAITELKNNKDGVRAVTVQGVLEQIPGLQDKKQISSSVFGYLTSVTPQGVSYNEVNLDVANKTMLLNGNAQTLEQANRLANNLKSAQFSYKKNGQSSSVKPFSAIVFENLTRSDEAEIGKRITFGVRLVFDGVLFEQGLSEQKLTTNASSEELLLPTAKPFSDTPVPGGQQ